MYLFVPILLNLKFSRSNYFEENHRAIWEKNKTFIITSFKKTLISESYPLKNIQNVSYKKIYKNDNSIIYSKISHPEFATNNFKLTLVEQSIVENNSEKFLTK